jgi:hypothetical protein
MTSIIDDKNIRRTVAEGRGFSAGDVHAHTQRTLRDSEMSAQEKRFCAFLRQGMPFEVACNAAGLSVERGRALAASNEVVASSQQHNFRLRSSEPLVTRDMLTLMLFEERERSSTASEGIAAIREMGRLNGLYPDQQPRLAPTRGGYGGGYGGGNAGVTVDGTVQEMSRNALSRKSDAELHELANAQIYNTEADMIQYDKEPATFEDEHDGEDEESAY